MSALPETPEPRKALAHIRDGDGLDIDVAWTASPDDKISDVYDAAARIYFILADGTRPSERLSIEVSFSDQPIMSPFWGAS